MEEPYQTPEVLLSSWLSESDSERARGMLEALVLRHAEPVIRRIVFYKLASRGGSGSGAIQKADVEDVCGTALYNLVARLARMKASGADTTVQNFTGYAATTAYNACHEFFRARKPAWLGLAMRIRYLSTHAPEFAVWETTDGQELCGFVCDRGLPPLSERTALNEASGKLRCSVDPSRLALKELVQAIFKAAGAPLPFDELVDVAAEWSGTREAQMRSVDDGRPECAGHWEQLVEHRPGPDTQIIDRRYIQHLWAEICQLPLEHRKSLLLNLNDSAGGDIQLLAWLGVATVEQIANTLDMDPLKFAALWKELPLDDARIARELGISRQDVINRRSSARKRLARRMKEFEGGNR